MGGAGETELQLQRRRSLYNTYLLYAVDCTLFFSCVSGGFILVPDESSNANKCGNY